MADTLDHINESQETVGKACGGLSSILLIAGAIGLGLTVAIELLFGTGAKGFFHRYLVAFAFCMTITLGCLFFVLIQHLTKAGWSASVRRIAEIYSLGAIPLAVLFLPVLVSILLGSHALYEWNDTEHVKTDPLLLGKSGYLNAGFFSVRAVIYFLVWIGLARLFVYTSVRQDLVGSPDLTSRMEAWSAPGTLAFSLTASFAAFDWLMSLAPHWYSTIFGVYVFAGCLVGCFATMALTVLWLKGRGFLQTVVNVEHQHDLGKLLFAFTCFWAYIAFSQYFLIWYANIPEETVWYKARLSAWKPVSGFLAIGHFILPFIFFMSRHIKRNSYLLGFWAAWGLFMHWVDLYWMVMPQMSSEALTFSLSDLTVLVGVVGIWGGAIGLLAKDMSVLAVSDPRLPEALAFKNV
jgi:hypothetical protein